MALILLGVFFHFYRAPKDAFVLFLAFLFTGLAILVYLNQKPFEPRERDYAYSGSFYFLCMWLAFGVYALYDFMSQINKSILIKLGYFFGGGLVVCMILGYGRLWFAQDWIKKNRGNYTITEKYYESNSSIRIGAEPAYEQTTLFPRMFDASDANKIEGYKSWSGYDPNDGATDEIGRDGLRLPTMGENLTYFFRYQVDWMYVRYLLWNFAGRQNDIQGNGDNLRGNWISGIDLIDAPRVGPSDAQPYFTAENPAHNKYYLIPLALILLGVFFHFYRAPKDAFVLF